MRNGRVLSRSIHASSGTNCLPAAAPSGRPMLRLASDADVHGEIIRGLRRRMPEIDLARVQDALGEGIADEEVLNWATSENRAVITNDRSTMIGLAHQRAKTGQPAFGLIATSNHQAIGSAIDDILLIRVYDGERDSQSGRRVSAIP